MQYPRSRDYQTHASTLFRTFHWRTTSDKENTATQTNFDLVNYSFLLYSLHWILQWIFEILNTFECKELEQKKFISLWILYTKTFIWKIQKILILKFLEFPVRFPITHMKLQITLVVSNSTQGNKQLPWWFVVALKKTWNYLGGFECGTEANEELLSRFCLALKHIHFHGGPYPQPRKLNIPWWYDLFFGPQGNI